MNVLLLEPAWMKADFQKLETSDLKRSPHSDSGLCFSLSHSVVGVYWNPPRAEISWGIASTLGPVNSKTNSIFFVVLCLVVTEFKKELKKFFFSNLQISFSSSFKNFWGICVFFWGGTSLLLNVSIIDTS